ncbi:thiamine pyrophosphate-dependent enzyme [Chloroflexota bacterium]
MEEKNRDIYYGEEFFKQGHLLCPGCSGGVIWRLITKVLGESSIGVTSASCLSLPAIMFPSSLKLPSLYVSFASASAAVSGVSAALHTMEKDGTLKERINLFVLAGDGGTADIGFASLSGAAERNEDVIYFCLDNEAYMNTGIQRSSQTPAGTWTTSTPLGKAELKKDMPLIMAAHGIPYVATASASYPDDLIAKIKKARDIGKGFKYIHIQAPCPTGWRFPENKTVEVGRLAVETGMWKLFETENGTKTKLTYKPESRRPVTDYLEAQGRFSRLEKKDIEIIQKDVDKECRKFRF